MFIVAWKAGRLLVKRRNEAQLKFRLTACIPIRKDQGMVQTIATLSCKCLALPKHSAEILRLSFYFVFYQLGLKHRDNPLFSSPWLSICRSHLLVHADLSSKHRYLQDWGTPKPHTKAKLAAGVCYTRLWRHGARDCFLAWLKPWRASALQLYQPGLAACLHLLSLLLKLPCSLSWAQAVWCCFDPAGWRGSWCHCEIRRESLWQVLS